MNPNLTVSYMAIVTERRSLDNRAARGCLAATTAAGPSASSRFVGPRQFVGTALARARSLAWTTSQRRFAPN